MNEEIRTELEQLGSPLAARRVEVPYAVEEGYFSGLQARMEADTTLPPITHPYTTPPHYFSSLPARVMERTRSDSARKVTITFRQLRVAAAAIVLLAVGMSIYTTTSIRDIPSHNGMLASIGDAEIKAYLGYTGETATQALVEHMDVGADEITEYLDETGWDTDAAF